MSKYGSSIVHKQDHQSANFERDLGEDLAVGAGEKDSLLYIVGTEMVDYASSTGGGGGGNKVKLPEIGYGVSHSTEVPDGFQKLNNGGSGGVVGVASNHHPNMNNFNSDPYALRIK